MTEFVIEIPDDRVALRSLNLILTSFAFNFSLYNHT